MIKGFKYFFYNKWLKYFGFNFLCSEKGRQKISISTDIMSVFPRKLATIVSLIFSVLVQCTQVNKMLVMLNTIATIVTLKTVNI
jgi:hypothetical protein